MIDPTPLFEAAQLPLDEAAPPRLTVIHSGVKERPWTALVGAVFALDDYVDVRKEDRFERRAAPGFADAI